MALNRSPLAGLGGASDSESDDDGGSGIGGVGAMLVPGLAMHLTPTMKSPGGSAVAADSDDESGDDEDASGAARKGSMSNAEAQKLSRKVRHVRGVLFRVSAASVLRFLPAPASPGIFSPSSSLFLVSPALLARNRSSS